MATAKKIQILPTKQSTIIDIPEIEDLRGKFVYNYFEKDEKINNPSLLDSRKISLTWTPNVIWNRRDLVDSIIIGDHYDLIIQEDEFNNHNLKTIDLNQSTGINQEVFQLVLQVYLLEVYWIVLNLSMNKPMKNLTNSLLEV